MEPTPSSSGELAGNPPTTDAETTGRTDRRTTPRAYRERPERPGDRARARLRELGPGLITGAADDDWRDLLVDVRWL